MLEDKTDSLQNADGDLENIQQEVQIAENADVSEVIETETTATVVKTIEPETAEIPVESATLAEEELEGSVEEVNANTDAVETAKTETAIEEVNDAENAEEVKQVNANSDAVNSISNSNAEESEDETIRHETPMADYNTLSMEELVAELETLVGVEKVMSVKDHVEELKKAFFEKYNLLIEEKKEAFEQEKSDVTEEFQYHFPLKSKLDQLYHQFRERKNTHFKSLQTNLKTNLENRLAIVEELRNLINPQEDIKDTLKHFNELRERWKFAGAIPKDKYNHVWNNYHFHVENFYDYLHLDREARDIDFKHNLDQKNKIISRVEELVQEEDITKAFRELQDLHKIWKEDIGPVSREHRDDTWNRFSDLTKQMHDKRELVFEKLREKEGDNLAIKNDIIAKIEVLSQEKVHSHNAWLQQIEKIEALRNEFFAAGKVPIEANEKTWDAFKTGVRNFNILKNSFYKDIKKDQNDNLTKKQALVAKANELKDSTDFQTTTPIMKKIQDEWKSIGHVPRKFSDKLWTEFRGACNSYFDNLKSQKAEENGEEIEAFDKKKEYLESLKDFQMTGEHKADLDAIKLHFETWKNFGKVPFSRRHIEGKFNKILDALFDKLSLSKKDAEMMRFNNRMDQLSENNDTRKLENEKIFLMRKIDEIQNEIFQLENNIQFFTNTRNAKKENSIVLEVRKNIEKHREEMSLLKDKLKQVRSI